MSQGPQTGGKKKKKGKGPSGPPPKALSIKIFVATEYPESSQKVLLFLQANYDAVCRLCCAHMPLPAGHLCTCTEYITRHCRWCLQATKTFPKDIAAKVRADESLVPKGDKKAMQRVMPFLQWVVNEVRHHQELATVTTLHAELNHPLTTSVGEAAGARRDGAEDGIR